MDNGSEHPRQSLPLSAPRDLEEVCRRFKDALKAGESPSLDDALGNLAQPERSAWLEQLLAIEAEYSQAPQPAIAAAAPVVPQSSPAQTAEPVASRAPTVGGPRGAETPDAQPGEHPARIGRYRIETVLEKGAFGRVYLAHDDQLQRKVAIKVPHRHLVRGPDDVKLYLAEAQVVASLDHPNIVPVYDVGQTEDGLCYVVSRFIEGNDLATWLEKERPSHHRSAELTATVAEALHHAHLHKVVHRDVKPANILLDSRGKPYLADFGLALREECLGEGRGWAGTPAYMSPEQARGESHLVDGRSDVFSLGVVFYELLTGARPFRAASVEQLLEQVKTREARPPRQVDDSIPKELERVCLKALSKRASDRYTTALDMADDLRHFVSAGQPPGGSGTKAEGPSARGGSLAASGSASAELDSGRPLRIVPKGLRSFDAEDADFFLELLPGPRDRNGLPESIRFWKGRIEETDADRTFRVGLIYGPSGCGKSSLVKAGLLPRLAPHVVAVYVEAAAAGTEARLLRGLRRHCPQLPAELGLKESVAALRRGQALPDGKKVLIVLDQFEQWLHAQQPEDNRELVEALRQCDAEHVQCIVMVRDDFAMAVTRFMRELEISQIEGHNVAAVDLFDTRHARRVLAALGRAFGALPPEATRLPREPRAFVEQAVVALAEDGKVVCVRLALLAEMIKDKPWIPATLKHSGGMEGIGVTFLEETLGAGTGTPERRAHQKAARLVLQALLPEHGSNIKGHLRSHRELLEASGYPKRPADFEALLRILDSELRLVTPTDPEGPEPAAATPADPSQGPADPTQRHYQLTHDYLVPSLRQWLTKKQRETRRGRAELRLAERAALWNAKPENRHLPACWEWASIRWLTRKKDQTPPQRRMMRKATGYHLLRGGLLLLVVLLVGLGAEVAYRAIRAEALVEAIVTAETAEVLPLVERLRGYRYWANPRLSAHLQASPEDSKEHLHASLALLPVDGGQVEYLCGRLLEAEPRQFAVIRKALLGHKEQVLDPLWEAAKQSERGLEGRRLRAACALAAYDPEQTDWDQLSGPVVEQLVTVNPVFLGIWVDALRPVMPRLVGPLCEVFCDRRPERTAERALATNILADYAADQPELLAGLLMDADPTQFARLYPEVEAEKDRCLPLLLGEVNKPWAVPATDSAEDRGGLPEDPKERLARRQANAAVALLKLGKAEEAWPLLRQRSDPRARSCLIHRFRPLGVDPRTLVRRLEREKEVSIRRALLLALGQFDEQEFTLPQRAALLPRLLGLYREDPDPGMHSAVEWLVRRWGKQERLKPIEQELATGTVEGNRRWYVTGQGHTLAVLSADDYLLAMATKEVTVEQFLRFRKDHHYNEEYAAAKDCPINRVTWYDAVAYCNWLSEQERIPKDHWCYEPNAQGQYAQGMKIKANYLSLRGYRLPTDLEWEFACRAGSVTRRYFAETGELLPEYAWHAGNWQNFRLSSVGYWKPNDWGLFDMLGNAQEWCQDRWSVAAPRRFPWLMPPLKRAGPPTDGPPQAEEITDQLDRVLRGGSFAADLSRLHANYTDTGRPGVYGSDVGFRPARTLREGPAQR